MRLSRLVALSLILLALIGTQPTRPLAQAASASAPADEYFGPFGYSALGIRTKIDALGRAFLSRWEDDASLMHDAGLIESSLRAWVRRYPHDPWAPSAAFHLAQLYAEIPSAPARSHALSLYRYVAQTFPATRQGHLARVRVTSGLPPPRKESPVVPTPAPYGRRTPAASAVPASSASAQSAALPTPVPTPATRATP